MREPCSEASSAAAAGVEITARPRHRGLGDPTLHLSGNERALRLAIIPGLTSDTDEETEGVG